MAKVWPDPKLLKSGSPRDLSIVHFDRLRSRSLDKRGVSRASYGAGEADAHADAIALARALDLEVETDAVGNLYMTWRGSEPGLKRWVCGSHLDTVHEGGNYDGAAGVVAGLAAIHAMKARGVRLRRTLTIVAWRAEECSTWFVGAHGGHMGSRMALGLLERSELETATHISTGRTLGQTLSDNGLCADDVDLGAPLIDLDGIEGFVELHIEQGPVLEVEAHPVGIVTAIRGVYRARNCRVDGVYTHSGGVPRRFRHDAVVAFAELVTEMQSVWDAHEARDEDFAVCFGKAMTNPKVHAIVKVPGEVDFAAELRAREQAVIDAGETALRAAADRCAEKHGVTINLDPIDRVKPAPMSEELQADLAGLAKELGVDAVPIACGGGHDAAEFVYVGIPTCMLFVRNSNGSHCPEEHMEIDDFTEATRLLTGFLELKCGAQA